MSTSAGLREDGSLDFQRFAGWAAVLAGVAGAGYAVSFVVLKVPTLSALFLTTAPLLATAGLVAVYTRLREVDAEFALLGLAFGLIGSVGAAVHGAYDIATILRPETGAPDLPNAIDPRGFLTFGLTGIALIILAWLATRSDVLPSWVGPLGLLLGVVLVLTWLGRLVVFEATNPLVLGPALVAGVLSPLFYLGLGAWLLGWRRA